MEDWLAPTLDINDEYQILIEIVRVNTRVSIIEEYACCVRMINLFTVDVTHVEECGFVSVRVRISP